MTTNQVCDHALLIPTANHEWGEILPVERVLQVIAHTSIDGNVSSGSPLNRNDAIQSKADGRDQRTAWLNEKFCILANFFMQRLGQLLSVFPDGWCLVIVHIAHSKSAAKIIDAEPL